MTILNISGCPKDARFAVLEMKRIDLWHSRVIEVYSYVVPNFLQQLFNDGKLHNRRIYPRPSLTSMSKWGAPSLGEMWEESLNITELQEYLYD